MSNPYVDLYAYSDFRRFLAGYYAARSAREASFNKAFICRKLGLPNSRSYFGDVVRGSKPLTPSKTESLMGILELSADEAAYFRTLVLFNQSGLASEKAFYLERLIALNKTPASDMDRLAFGYYRDWHHSTIRALLDVYDIGEDPSPLAKAIQPAVSLARIKRSLALLRKLGLIRKNGSGHWKPSDKIIQSGPYLHEDVVRKYQADCQDVAKSVILAPGGLPRHVSTETISLSA